MMFMQAKFSLLNLRYAPALQCMGIRFKNTLQCCLRSFTILFHYGNLCVCKVQSSSSQLRVTPLVSQGKRLTEVVSHCLPRYRNLRICLPSYIQAELFF